MDYQTVVVPSGARIVVRKDGLGRRVWRKVARPLLIWLLWLALAAARAAARGVGRLLRAVTVGRWRYQAAPFWTAAAAVAPGWPVAQLVPPAPAGVAWGGAAVAVYAWPQVHDLLEDACARRGWRAPRRFLSARECQVVSAAFVGVSAWWMVVWVLPVAGGAWWVPGVLVMSAAPWWWRARRVVPPPAPPAIVAEWEEKITHGDPSVVGSLAGTRLVDFSQVEDTEGGPEGDAALELPFGTVPSAVTTKDELAQHVLDLPSGTVQIGLDPGRSTRQVRVRFTSRTNSDRVFYFQEPTYDPSTGSFLAGYAHERAPGRASLCAPGSIMHWSAVASTGGGKGGTSRLVLTEANLSRDWLTIVLDGKKGTGIPSVRDGVGYYARTPEEWVAAFHVVMQILDDRMVRYGEVGRDRFSPNWQAGEPGIMLWADEWKIIHEAFPALKPLAATLTAQGRSLGVSFGAAMQKGDAYGWGDIAIRGNVYGCGWNWVGTAGDANSAGVATQTYGVDLSQIPPASGWGAWLSKANDDATGDILRGCFLPSQSDVDDGAPHPFGRCEDWNAQAAREGLHRPALHPATQAIFDRLVAGDPDVTVEAQDRLSDAERVEQNRVQDLILAHLAGVDAADSAGGPDAAEGVGRGDIAKAIGKSLSQVSKVLGELKEAGLVEQTRSMGPYVLTAAGREQVLEGAR